MLCVGALIICCCFGGWAQSQSVSYDFKGTSLSDALKEFHRQTDVDFAYDNFALSKILVSDKAQNIPLQNALDRVLNKTGYRCQWVNTTCIIVKNQEQPQPTDISFHDILATIVVSGTLYDVETNETLPFASVSNSSSKQGFTTNADGHFHAAFQQSHPEDTIVFTSVGYETKKVMLVHLIQQKPQARIGLEPKRLYLPTVLITAGSNEIFKTDADNTNVVFNPNDLVTLEGLGEADVYRAAQILPGISSTQENSGGLFIRGSSSDQTLMKLDGFTIYHQDHLFGMFSAVNSEAVKSVRIHKNVPHSRQGGRIGGLVEMIGKEGNTAKGNTQINLGMLSGAFSVEGPLDTAGTIGFIFNGRRALTDGWYSPAYKRIFSTVYSNAIVSDNNENKLFEGTNEPSYFFQDANIKLTWKPNAENKFSSSFYTSRDQLYINYLDTTPQPGSLQPSARYTDESRWENTGFSVNYVHQRQPGSPFSVRATFSDYTANYFSTDTIVSINDVTTAQIQNTETNLRNYTLNLEKEWALTYHEINIGAETEHVVSKREHQYSSQQLPQKLQQTIWQSAFIHDAWAPSLRWRLSGGWRMTYDQLTKRLMQEPRMLVTYRWPLLRLHVEAGYARMHQLIQRLRPQNLYQNNPDYWALSDDQNIPVLASDQWSAGIHKAFTKGHVHLDAFARLQRGSTLFLAGLPGYEQGNDLLDSTLLTRGSSQSHGIELSAFFAHRNHQWTASYTWLSSTGNYEAIDNRIIVNPFEHRHELKCYYEYQANRWDFGIFWTYGSGRPFTPVLGTYSFSFPNGDNAEQLVYGDYNSRRLPPYHRMDVSAHYKLNWKKSKVVLGASIYNAYNRTNIRSIQYFAIAQETQLDYFQSNLNMLGIVPSLNINIRF